jgi:signal transduction histidine kinase/PAS domain-containing protein
MPSSPPPSESASLADLLEPRRQEVIQRWMERVAGRLPPEGLTRAELVDSLPDFLQEVVLALRRKFSQDASTPLAQVAEVAERHGRQRHRLGSNINAVVWEYGVLRDVLMEFIQEQGWWVPLPEWHVISQAITTGISEAVSHFSDARERELRISQTALEHGDACFVLDPDWRVVFVNRKQEQLSRTPRQESLGRVFWDIFPLTAHPDSPYWREYHRVMEQRVETFFEAYYAPLDLWTATTAYPMVGGGIVVFFRDVTERKRTESIRDFFLESGRILASSLELGATLRSLALIVAEHLADYCLVDLFGADGKLHRVEAATKDEALQPLLERAKAFPPRLRSQSPLALCVERGEVLAFQEVTPELLDAISLSAEHRSLLDALAPKTTIFAPLMVRGRKLGLINLVWRRHTVPVKRYLEVARGVADQAAVAIDNARLYQEAQEAARIREEVVGIVSHDLRNPLAAISMTTTVLLKREELSPAVAKGLSRIYAASDRAARLTNDLLDFTQARVGALPLHPRAANFLELARQVVEEVQLAHPERELRMVTAGEGHGAWDVDRLAQVITNLVGNAVQHSPQDTPVHISARGEDSTVVLEVRNQGNPIPPELLPRLFEPFRRGDSAEPGRGSVGLGLYISQQVVLGHGGRIDVRSSREGGTTFTVWLPRQPPPRLVQAPAG